MKTTLTALVLLFFALLIYYRQRIYVRDPLATVYRDNVQQADVEVFINYSNDVLLLQPTEPYRILVQDWNKMPGTPTTLTCLRWTACLTEADKATTIPLTSSGKSSPANQPARHADKATGKYDPKVFMASRQVTFTDPNNSPVRIDLR